MTFVIVVAEVAGAVLVISAIKNVTVVQLIQNWLKLSGTSQTAPGGGGGGGNPKTQ